MKRSTKTISIILIFFLIIAAVIIGRTMIGNHFKKKFSKRPPPGIIVTEVLKKEFGETIETFGTAISKKSETFKIKKDDLVEDLKLKDFVKKGEILIKLKSGNIQNSFCIPFNNCLNSDKTFKNREDLKVIFKRCLKTSSDKNVVFSCGSGVTACVLALAYSLINDKYLPCIYDGSWAEYGLI